MQKLFSKFERQLLPFLPSQQQQQTFIEQTCQICYIEYKKIINQYPRPATICYNCWHQHVKANITKISYKVGSNIISPFQGGNEIDVIIALNGLNKQHRQQLQEWLFKKYNTFTTDIQKCPSETCDYVFTMEKCKWIVSTQHKCPKCQISLTVTPSFSLKSFFGFIYFLFLANKCPKCQIPIQRISGCPHMTCPCGHQFCWFCLKDHCEKVDNLYSVHQPKQCAFIFFSKIIILLTCLINLPCLIIGGQTIRYLMQIIFDILSYIIHSIIIDLFILAQYKIIDIHIRQPYRYVPFKNADKKVKLGLLIGVNLFFIGFLYLFDLLQDTLFILVLEAVVVSFGGLMIYGIMYSVQTWFDFIV